MRSEDKSFLGDIDILSGFPFASENFTGDIATPLIRIRDLLSGEIQTYYRGAFDKAYIVKQGDILVGMDGDFSVVRWKGVPALLNQRICKISSTSNDLDNQFLYWWLKPHIEEIHRKTPQTTVRHLSTHDIYRISAPKISKDEQAAAAWILNTIDAAIEKSEALIAKFKQVRAGMLHDLLTCGVDESGEIRDAATNPNLFKGSPIGLIPREWRLTNIADLADSITSGSRGWAAYYSDQGSLFLRIGNLTREHINLRFDDVQYVNPPRGAEGQRTKVEANDLLVSITADLGIVGMIPPNFRDAYVNQHIALVRFKAGMKFPRWVGHLLSSQPYQRVFQALNDSGAKAGFNLNAVGALPVVLPSSEAEQDKIVRTIDSFDEDISKQQTALEKLRKLKSGLSADLLTGQVRVPPDLELP